MDPLIGESCTVVTSVMKALSVEYSRTDSVNNRPGLTDTEKFASLPVTLEIRRSETVGSVPRVVKETTLLIVEPNVLVAVIRA